MNWSENYCTEPDCSDINEAMEKAIKQHNRSSTMAGNGQKVNRHNLRVHSVPKRSYRHHASRPRKPRPPNSRRGYLDERVSKSLNQPTTEGLNTSKPNSETEILDVAPIDFLNGISHKFIKFLPFSDSIKAQALDIEFYWVNVDGEDTKLTAGLTLKPTVN